MSKTIAGAGLLGTVLCLSLIQPAAAAPSGSLDDQWLPNIAGSASLSTPVLASGKLTTADGQVFPKGATVELVAYPSAEVVDAMIVGDSIQVTPVAKAIVGDGGQFEIRLPDGADFARYASDVGNVDLEVRAVSGTYYAAYSFSAPSSGLRAFGLDNTAVAAARAGTAAELAPATGLSIQSLPANTAVASLAASTAGPLNKTDVCGETLVADYGSQAVVVGGTYTGGSKRTGAFTYQSGSSSSLGVGLSTSGKKGSYSVSGTNSRSSTSTVSFAAGTGGRTYKTYFKYGKYSQWCYPVYDPGAKSVYAYKVHASSFAGGSAISAASVPSASKCVPLATGSSYSKSTTSASTFASGASVSGLIGIDLSSKTGFTTTSKVKYTNTYGSSRNLCGVKDVPGGSPGAIVLK